MESSICKNLCNLSEDVIYITISRKATFNNLTAAVFAENRYWDVFAEYAKCSPNDVLCRYTMYNRGPDTATIHVLPQLWYRNTWIWGCTHEVRYH